MWVIEQEFCQNAVTELFNWDMTDFTTSQSQKIISMLIKANKGFYSLHFYCLFSPKTTLPRSCHGFKTRPDRCENVHKAMYKWEPLWAICNQLSGFVADQIHKIYQPKVCVCQQLYGATPKHRKLSHQPSVWVLGAK